MITQNDDALIFYNYMNKGIINSYYESTTKLKKIYVMYILFKHLVTHHAQLLFDV